MKSLDRSLKAALALATLLLCLGKVNGAATPVTLQPASQSQGSTSVIVLQDAAAHFQAGVTTVSFGSGIAAGQIAVNGPTLMAVPIQISESAPSGVHQVVVMTGSEVLNGAFTVTAGQASVASIYPNAAAPPASANSAQAVALQGNFTHWTNGKTVASFGTGIAVGGGAEGQPGPVSVSSSGSLVAQISIDPAAALGPRTVSITTGTEVETVPQGFTVMTCSSSAPTIVSTDPSYNDTAPVNTAIRITYSAPLDRTTVDRINFQWQENNGEGSQSIPTPLVSLDASGRVLTIVPVALLPAFEEIYGSWTYPSLKDSCGNALFPAQVYFSTNGTVESAPFQLAQTGFADGAVNLPLNTRISLRFNQPLDPSTAASGLVLSASGVPVAGQFSFSTDGTVATLVPTANLTPNTQYVVSYSSALHNQAANAISNPGTLKFTTGTWTGSPGDYAISFPSIYAPVATNVIPTITFKQPIDLTSVQANMVQLMDPSGKLVPGAGAVSQDHLSYTFTPAALLIPNALYTLSGGLLSSITGITGGLGGEFTTGPSSVGVPHETGVSPPDKSTSVPENTEVAIQYDQPIDPGSVGPDTVVIKAPNGTVVTPGSVSVGLDGRTAVWALPSGVTLSANTTYSVQATSISGQGSGVSAAFSSSFTTGNSVSGPLCCELQLQSMTPAFNATGVGANSPITLTFNKLLDPTSLSNSYVTAANENTVIGGVWTVNGPTATFVPSTPYPPSSTISVSVVNVADYTGSVTDVESEFYTASFTQPETFKVVAVTPVNGQTGVANHVYPTITFSGPVNVASLSTPGALQFLGGDSELKSFPIFSVSKDARTVTLSGLQPGSSTIKIFANSSVQDLYGNPLQPFEWSFSTGSAAQTAAPSVMKTLPTGFAPVPANSSIQFFLNRAGIDPSTLTNAVTVTANGVVFEGSASLTQNGQVLVWQPAEPFPAGATVSYFLNSSLTDLYGNPVAYRAGSFTVQGVVLSAAPQVASINPYYNDIDPPNTLIQIELSEPVLSSSVNSSDVQVLNTSNVAVPGSPVVTGAGGNVIQFIPESPLPSASYQIMMNQGATKVTNTAGVPAANFGYSFEVSGSADHTPPAVSLAVPPPNATVGVNAVLTIQFTKPIDFVSVDSSTVQLHTGSASVPLGFALDTTRQILTITPQQALAPSTFYTISVAGVYDIEGNALPAWNRSFSSGSGPDLAGPQLVSANILWSGQLATNDALVLRFDKPIAPGTVNSHTMQVTEDIGPQTLVPGAWSLSADGQTATFSPAQPWPLESSFFLGVGGNVTDVTGNVISLGSFGPEFYTGLNPAVSPLKVQSVNPESSLTNVPLNTLIQVGLNEPVAAISPGKVTLVEGGVEVAASVSISSNGDVITVTPSQLLLPQTLYTLTVSGLSDPAGNKLNSPFIKQFTTGGVPDGVAGAVIALNPAAGAIGIGTSDPVTVYLSTPVDPTTFVPAEFTLMDYNGASVPGTVSVAVDGKSVIFRPAQKLIAGVQYSASFCLNINLGNCSDANGNQIGGDSWSFTTAATAQARPSVISISPPSGSKNVPENAQIAARLSAPMNAGLVNSTNVVVTDKNGNTVGGSVAVAPDGTTLLFALTPGTSFAAGMTYTVKIAGIYDQNGNASAAFSSTFTTAATVITPGPGSFTVVGVTPAQGTVLPTNTSPITVTFSSPVNPVTVKNGVSVSTGTGQGVAANWTVSGSNLTFTPLTPFPANSTIAVGLAPSLGPALQPLISDYAGNVLDASYAFDFTTAATADTSAPRVTSITPANGSTSVGQNSSVVLTFSKSVDQSTLKYIALFAKGVVLPSSTTNSADNRTVTISAGLLPGNTTMTIVATPGVKDLSGNSLIDFQSSFTTGNAMPGQNVGPAVVSVRPANGAAAVPLTAPIYIFVSGAALNSGSVQSALHVAQNGEPVIGATQLIDGQIIQFIPSTPFAAGALIQIFLDGTLQDVNGNPFRGAVWQSSFSTAGFAGSTSAALVATDVLASNPLPANGVLDYAYNQALDPASIGPDTVKLTDNCTGAVQTGTTSITGLDNNILRFVPGAALTPGCQYRVEIGSSSSLLRTSAGETLPPHTNNFQAAAANSRSPSITAISPPNGFTKIGVNAAVYVSFSTPINPTSLSSSSIQLSDSSGTLAGSSISLATGGQLVTVTPQAPLPASATMTLSITGLTDAQGNAFPSVVEHFTTGAGPDFTPPVLNSTSPGVSPIPLNTRTITLTFSKPMNPATLMASGFQLQGLNLIPGTVGINSSMTAFSFPAGAPLSAGQILNFQALGPVLDLAGNPLASSLPLLSVGSTVDSAPLQVVGVNPPANLQNVPQNVLLQAKFSAEVAPNSLGGIQLLQGGSRVSAVATWLGDATVSIVPQQVLKPNLPYTLSIAGVKDALGNALTGIYTSSFTTAETLLEGTPVGTVTVPSSSSNVSPDTIIQVKFSHPMNPLSFVPQPFGSALQLLWPSSMPIPVTFSLSADGLTGTWTPVSPLLPGSYTFGVTGADIAGNNQFFGVGTSFTVP